MKPPYDEMPSQIFSGSGQFDGYIPTGKKLGHHDAGLTIVLSPILAQL